MVNINKLKIGDIIIRFGQVYKVFKTEKKDDGTIISYKKLFKNPIKAPSIFSIPQNSIVNTKIRGSITKKGLDSLLGAELKAFEPDLEMNINTIKAVLNTDDPTEIMKIMKNLATERKINEKFPFSKKEVYGTLLKRFSSEVAYVYKTNPEKGQEIIEEALDKAI